jgi:hypothetical protein
MGLELPVLGSLLGLAPLAAPSVAGVKAIDLGAKKVDEVTGWKAQRESQEADIKRKEEETHLLLEDFEKRREEEKTAEANLRQRTQQRMRQRQLAASAVGRRGTLLTGPLGVPGGNVPFVRKELLGL